MDITRVQIGLLDENSNWTWKYKQRILLREISRAIDVLEGKIVMPSPVSYNASVEVLYDTALHY